MWPHCKIYRCTCQVALSTITLVTNNLSLINTVRHAMSIWLGFGVIQGLSIPWQVKVTELFKYKYDFNIKKTTVRTGLIYRDYYGGPMITSGKRFQHYWPFVIGIHRSLGAPVTKHQLCGTWVFSLLLAWKNCRTNCNCRWFQTPWRSCNVTAMSIAAPVKYHWTV